MTARGKWLRFPHLLIKAFQTAVEMVRAIVLCQRVFLAVENELAVTYAVGDATGDGAEERMPPQVTVEVVEAEHDVAIFSVSVRHVQLGDDRAKLGDPGDHAARSPWCINLHWRSVRHLTEDFFVERHHVFAL